MSQLGSPSYEVERPTGVCAVTGRAIEPGEAYMATLCETPPEEPGGLGLKRLDVTMDAWQKDGRPAGLFSYWKATLQPPGKKKKVFVDDQTLLALFMRLGEPDQAHRAAFRFVLGLILMRKRLLRHLETCRRDQVPVLEVEKVDRAGASAGERAVKAEGEAAGGSEPEDSAGSVEGQDSDESAAGGEAVAGAAGLGVVVEEWWRVSVRGEDEPVWLPDPKLDDQRIEEIMDEFNQILDLDDAEA